MAPTDRTPVQQARQALVEARRALIDRGYEYETASAALEDGKRRLAEESAELVALQTAESAAFDEFLQARNNETVALDSLQQTLATWLPDGTPLADDFERLAATSPIVLFPVRVETRFDDLETVSPKLKVRIFPDEIFLNIHETALTREEYAAARHYYEELNINNNERELWRDIIARFGVERSAYILRQMLPVFGDPGPQSSFSSSSSTCGGTIFGGNKEDLFFPSVQLRSDVWTRPGEAVLPDRWVVTTYRGAEKLSFLGNRIPEPLAMTTDPKQPDDSNFTTLFTTTRGDYRIDDNIRWTVDFARAVQVGMGVEIALSQAQAEQGFDRIIVVGVKSSMDEIETSRMLEKLFDAHHYTRGMAIVRQGAPTNNTEGRATPFPFKENAGEVSFGIERQRAPLDREFAHHCLPNDTDGYYLATTLGVPSGVMANIERAYQHEIESGRAMNRALWPGTIGYFMRHMMDSAFSDTPIFTPVQIENTRRYFERYVLARGSAPAFRIGGTPYGVVPIASLAHWQPHGSSTHDNVEAGLLNPLRYLLSIWLENVEGPPRIKQTANPDVDLAEVLSTSPSADQFWIRWGIGVTATTNIFLLEGWDVWLKALRFKQASHDTFGRIGHPQWEPVIGATSWHEDAWIPNFDVVAPLLSETAPLVPNFIAGIRDALASDLNNQTHALSPTASNFFYMLLRHSTLAEYSRLVAANASVEWREHEIFGLLSVATGTSIITSVTETDPTTLRTWAASYLNTLTQLSSLPTAELHRLFTETMDLTSHRLDAWISAFAVRRLANMRDVQDSQLATGFAPKGDYLGGYAWLENVRPRQITPYELPDGRQAEARATNGGFIHTPSLSHAAAAAVLRNGNLSFRGDSGIPYAVDLSSRRVREGRALFQGVRNGQPVGALLGYQFERALHEGHPTVMGLDDLRFTLRSRFPLVANKSGQDPSEPAESIAARNVVDGDELLRAYQEGALDFANDPELPSPGSAQYNAMITELGKLERRFDAAADLLTAESVFQLVRGNIDGAYPTMENLVEGRQPPESVISKSARTGVGISHRVSLVFPSDALPTLPAGWPGPTPRATAEPVLDAWVGALVGDAAEVSATLSYLDEEGGIIQSNGGEDSVQITLGDLELRPLDLLALAEAIARENEGAILDRRIIQAGLDDATDGPASQPASFSVQYDSQPGRSFPEVLEVLHSAEVVLRSSRPLALTDLLSPAEVTVGSEEEDAEPVGGANALAFYERGKAARVSLANAVSNLGALGESSSGAQIRTALEDAAHFASFSAFPDPLANKDQRLEQAAAVHRELSGRLARLPTLFEDEGGLAPDEQPSVALIARGNELLQGVFGSSFVALPDVTPPRADEIQMSLDARATLLDGDDEAPARYLQQMMRARERLGRWRKLNLYARTMGVGRPRVDVVQLPHVPGEKWLGLPFGETPPEEGRSALLVLSYGTSLETSVNWSGLVIDDWTEVIPRNVEDTAFALHYESPQGQAPQAILVATPSTADDMWTFEELLGSLEQSMDLMKIRLLNQEHLDVGQALPMAILAENPNIENTVSTTIGPVVQSADAQGLDHG